MEPRFPKSASPFRRLLVVSAYLLSPRTFAFTFQPCQNHPHLAVRSCSHKECLALFGSKVQRGKLGKMIDDSSEPLSMPAAKRKNRTAKAPRGRSSSKTGDAPVSPDLAKWMDSLTDQSTQSDDSRASEATTSAPEGATFTSFDDDDDFDSNERSSSSKSKKSKRKSSSSRRSKQSERKVEDDAQRARVEAWVSDFESMLGQKEVDDDDSKSTKGKKTKPAELGDILRELESLLEISSQQQSTTPSLRPLLAATTPRDFRLAWVGSDEAVTHVGTGLHKVPLARLQEVFLSTREKMSIQLQEVIRILGPFPNIKNVLQASITSVKTIVDENAKNDRSVVLWKITWDSMIDGTGKELLAPGQEKGEQQIVWLQVYVAEPSVVVAVVPPNSDDPSILRENPLEDDGAHVLVLVGDAEMDRKLEALRVA